MIRRTERHLRTTADGRRWVPAATAAWVTAYAVVHAWWAVRGAPRFAEPGESFFPGGWLPVVPAVLSAAAILLVASGAERDRSSRVRWALAALGGVSGVALVLYSFMFPLSLLMILGGLFGMDLDAMDWVTLLARGSGALGGAVTIAIAVGEQRRARGGCRSCGRVHGRRPEGRDAPAPSWAFFAGYLTVAACLARFVAEMVHGFVSSKAPEIPWAFMITFIVLLLLAGTLLPLALVHHWGRIWPGWVLPLAGRQVPRWLVAGPGFFLGAGLTTYFGIGGMTAWATGNNVDGAGWFLAVVLPAYTLWGLGLLVATSSYVSQTKPECPLNAPAPHG
ncbi:hypothetical protein ACGFH8_24565 [Micromonospora sp. NPDC049175]|uniref:hypothetical protein n=1 Tax=Micromonospora sp. NPDC049175 TaxID=3364266 RepID=UPI0037193189